MYICLSSAQKNVINLRGFRGQVPASTGNLYRDP